MEAQSLFPEVTPTQFVEIIIPGAPIPKKRHRSYHGMGGRIGSYSPQTAVERKIKIFIKAHVKDITMEAVNVTFDFFVSRPKSHYGTGKNTQIIKATSPQYPTSKPDIDNYIKFYLDCMNGIIFKDDSQVIGCYAHKKYAENGRTEIRVFSQEV